MFQKYQIGKGKISCGWSFGQPTNGTDTSKMFRCGSQYHLIAKCPKPQEDNEKQKKQVRFNKKAIV